MMSNSGVGVEEPEEGIGCYYMALQQEEVQTHAAGFIAKLHFILSLRWNNYQLPQSGRRRHLCFDEAFYLLLKLLLFPNGSINKRNNYPFYLSGDWGETFIHLNAFVIG